MKRGALCLGWRLTTITSKAIRKARILGEDKKRNVIKKILREK